MSQIKFKNTNCEIIFRKYIWSKGFKNYRIKNKILGKPDLYFSRTKIAIFIDGCFWHKCTKCFINPKSNKTYWNKKIEDNINRDNKTNSELEKIGISVLRFWEHEIKENTNDCFLKFKTLYEKKLKTIDLFAGIGGIRIAFERSNFKTVFANDIDKFCKKTYDLNFKDTKLDSRDIFQIKSNQLPDFDFLLAGFPCQPFSIAGYREGFDDRKGRGNLFFEIERIIRDKNPIGFMLENVKNLKNHDHGNAYKEILRILGKLGYYVKDDILNSMIYGNIPQNRERIYIVGFRSKDHYDRFAFPKPKTLTNKFSDFLEEDVNEKYYYNNKILFEKLKEEVIRYDTIYQWRRKYVRENKSGVCPTLTANMGSGGHNVPIIRDNKGIRKLTPRECMRLQGFPDDFILPDDLPDSKLYHQIGNSVTVTVVEEIAKAIYNIL
jgi:DNA (cytosine-5)-methyltransferase 1